MYTIDKNIKVLVSSASAKIPLIYAMQKAVQYIDPSGKVVAGDLNDQALSSFIADDFWHMPPTQDELFNDIRTGITRRAINFIVPTRDDELTFWARYMEIFQEMGVHIIVSKEESLNLCLDKLAFAKFGMNRGYPFIPTSLEINDVDAKRYVVKERFGAGSQSIGINLTYDAAIKHAKPLKEPVFQPFVCGSEISIDAWLDKTGRVKGVVPRYRTLVINGESQVTTTFNDPVIESQAIKILEALQLSGPVVLQAFIDEHKKIHIIECNPRFGGASTASLAVGLDSLTWSIQEALGQDMSQITFTRLPHQIRQMRVPQDLYVDDFNF